MDHVTADELEAGLDEIRRSPADEGRVELIVARPQRGGRELLDDAQLDPLDGLVGDNGRTRGSTSTPDGAAHPARQLTFMNARAIALIARSRDRWALAGDQVYVDLDVSVANLPPGTRLALGSAIVEVTAEPHTGCANFTQRFGLAAMRFVNSPAGRELNLRGINTRVVAAGRVRPGDSVRKL
jgi:MOSC domain-containing protein YiiM